MSFNTRVRPPGHLLTLFLAVTVAPAGGLVWLGWRRLDQDRALESRRQGLRTVCLRPGGQQEFRLQDYTKAIAVFRELVLG